VEEIKIDYTLDLQGEPCPYPLIYSLEVLDKMEKGQVLELIADCPQSFRSVPEEAVKHGYTLLAGPFKEGPVIRFYIQK
jgi:TusA-related sulfurtransferase